MRLDPAVGSGIHLGEEDTAASRRVGALDACREARVTPPFGGQVRIGPYEATVAHERATVLVRFSPEETQAPTELLLDEYSAANLARARGASLYLGARLGALGIRGRGGLAVLCPFFASLPGGGISLCFR